MKFDVLNTTHQKKALTSVNVGERVIIPPESEDTYDLDPSVATISLAGVTITPTGTARKDPVVAVDPVDPPVKPTPAPPALKSAPLPLAKAPATPPVTPVKAPVVVAPVKAPAGAPPAQPVAAAPAPEAVATKPASASPVSEGLADWQKGLEAPK